ncbi:MAG: acyl carrier protein [Oleispira sp.]
MNKNEILSVTQEIFRDIFDEDDMLIQDSTNSDDIEEWDSLNHINLVTSIEKEFNIRFALGELVSLKNVGEMLNLIIEKLK